MTAVRITHPGSTTPGFVPLDTLAWWEARGWTADPTPLPTDTGLPGLEARYSQHAADETIHGGARLLGQAKLSANPTVINSSTAAPIAGLTISFVCPDDEYEVEFQATVLVAAAAAWGTIGLYGQIGAGTAVLMGSDGHYAPAANSVKTLRYTYPLPNVTGTSPNAPAWHQPQPGDQVTYHVRGARASGTGDVTVLVDDAFWGKNVAFLRAKTVAG